VPISTCTISFISFDTSDMQASFGPYRTHQLSDENGIQFNARTNVSHQNPGDGRGTSFRLLIQQRKTRRKYEHRWHSYSCRVDFLLAQDSRGLVLNGEATFAVRSSLILAPSQSRWSVFTTSTGTRTRIKQAFTLR